MAQNLATSSGSDVADVEAPLAAIVARTTSARGAACMVDIAGVGVILCTREFYRANGRLSWKFRITSNESGKVSWSKGKGISLRLISRPCLISISERVSSAKCLDSSLTLLSSSLESVSSIIRVSAPSSMSTSHDVALVTLLASAFKIQI